MNTKTFSNDPIYLKDKAKTIRRHVINMLYNAKSGHMGGSLSCVDILVVLYFSIIRKRDRFVLSKGHAAPALYAVLAECGYIPIEDLITLRKNNGLEGHPDYRIKGIEVSSGSLGQGLSVANGIALANKIDGKNSKVFVLLGDGECDEGQVWEAAMLSAHYELNNVIAIIDRNMFQIDGLTEDVMKLEPFTQKWRAFGWHILDIVNGNDINEVVDVLNYALHFTRKPTVVIAHTTKGSGVSFMEGNNFHARPMTDEEYDKAMGELT